MKYLISLFFITTTLIKCNLMENNPMYKHNANEFFTGKELLVAEAIRNNHPQDIQNIVDENPSIDLNKVGKQGMTLLLWACSLRQPEAVEKLLQLKADPNQIIDDGKSKSHLVAMCAGGIVDKTFELLLMYHGDANGEDKGDPATHIAVKARRLDRLKLLLNKGADINGLNKSGDILIYYCCLINQFEMVAYLIEKGADFNRKDKIGGCVALEVQETKGRLNDKTEMWRSQVEKMLTARGVVFPVERPWEKKK